MPGGDRTGPSGYGPMSGRAAGLCAGFPVPGYMNPVSGQGFGPGRGFRGRGGGRGRRNRYYATGLPFWARADYGYAEPPEPKLTAQQEMEDLKHQAQFLQDSLSQINERIEQLEKVESQ